MKTRGYRFAIKWIAGNDEPEEMDVDVVAGYPTTMVVADIFFKDTDEVARAVVREREKQQT